MRRSKTLARLRQGQAARVCCLGHYIPAYVAHAARAGYDCIWLDLEHRALTLRELEALLGYSHLYDIDMVVRPPTTEKSGLARMLEDGASGLMIPLVETAEQAAEMARAVHFPPLGNRGLDNGGLDSDFHVHDADTYVDWVANETLLVVQIETPEAVRNADAIAATAGVDVLFIGPGDLSLRLRRDPEAGMTMEDAWQAVAAACKKHGKHFGAPVIARDQMLLRHQQGARFLVNNTEFGSWAAALQNDFKAFEALE